jgi:hypothetical protein
MLLVLVLMIPVAARAFIRNVLLQMPVPYIRSNPRQSPVSSVCYLSLSRTDTGSSVSAQEEPVTTQDFAASRLGLDPSVNRFHPPFVYHENYSFDDWPDNHTFPVRGLRVELLQ